MTIPWGDVSTAYATTGISNHRGLHPGLTGDDRASAARPTEEALLRGLESSKPEESSMRPYPVGYVRPEHVA
jgi:hypothetical protein